MNKKLRILLRDKTDKEYEKWLYRKNIVLLGGKSPIELIEAGEENKLLEIIEDIKER